MIIKSIEPNWNNRTFHFKVVVEGRKMPSHTISDVTAEQLCDYKLFQEKVLASIGWLFTWDGEWYPYIADLLSVYWEKKREQDLRSEKVRAEILTEDHRKERDAQKRKTEQEDTEDPNHIINVCVASS